jgi:hypothetical protein
MAQIACSTPISRRQHVLAGGAVLLLSLLGAASATVSHAEVNVTGTVAAVRIVASQDSVAKILFVVTQNLNVRYRTFVPLDQVVTGIYSGSLTKVISRLLNSYNYVIKHERETFEILVLGRRGAHPIAAQSHPAASSAQSFAAQWR